MPESSVTLRELLIKLGVIIEPQTTQQVKAFDGSIDAVKSNLGKAKTAAFELKDGIVSLIGWLAKGAIAAGAFFAGLVYQAKETSDYAVAVERQSEALGLTTDAYQEYRIALQSFGVDQRDVADLFSQIAQQAQSAMDGSAGMVDKFAAIGLSVEDLQGKDPGELFELIADGLASTTDETKRLAIAGSLLGEDLTKKVLPVLMKGSKGLDELKKKAHDTGAVMSKESIAAAKRFSAALGTLGLQVQGIRNELGGSLVPALARAAEAMSDWVTRNREFLSLGIKEFVERFAQLVDRVTIAAVEIDRQVQRWTGWKPILIGLAAGVAALVGAMLAFKVGGPIYYGLSAIYFLLMAAAAALGLVGGTATLAVAAVAAGVVSFFAVALAPWVVLLASIVAVALALDDVRTYLRGGQSAVGEFLAAWEGTDGILGAVAGLVRAVIGLGVALTPLVDLVGNALVSAFNRWAAAVQPVYDLIYSIGAALLSWGIDDMITKITTLTQLVQGITGVVDIGNSAAGLTGPRPAGAAFAPTSPASVGARGSVGGSTSSESNVFNIAGSNAKEIAEEVAQRIAASKRLTRIAAVAGGIR